MGTVDQGEVEGEYYYNLRTKMVEHGRLSPWEHLMGPYETHEDAERALEIAQARNADWDEDEVEWAGDWDAEDEHPAEAGDA